MIIQIKPELIVFNRKFQGLCAKPYYGHARGCPNFGKKKGCPPGLELIDSVLDFEKDIYVVYTRFPVGEFAERMRQAHPEWSEHPRQWYNPRRWQGMARKIHRKEEARAREKYGILTINNPEALGVNVTDLMKNIGIELRWDWPPKHILKDKKYLENFTYLVSMGGKGK